MNAGDFVTYGPSTGPPPNFPASAQDPNAVRTNIAGLWVDYLTTAPTVAQVNAQAAPTAALITASDRAALIALIGSPTGQMRVIVALAKQLYADLSATVPAFASKYPTLGSWVTAIEAMVNQT
jgi:hypothetical protein